MILHISKLPPPIGGVTIHVKRLVQKLKNREEYDVEVLDYSRVKNPLKVMGKVLRAKLIHIHLSNKKIRFWVVLFLRLLFKKVVVTFHGKYDFENYYDRTVLKVSYYSIVLNKVTYKNALKYNSQVKLIGAFIPPIEEEIIDLDVETEKIINNTLNRDYDLVFCTNASSYVLDSNGNEIYMGTELVKFFAANQNIALIFSDPSGTYAKHFYKEKIKIPENICLINKQHDFVNIIKKSDAMLRATTMDGDSLSIKEALYYNKLVYATDVVDRPNGVIGFKDFNCLKKLLLNVTSHNYQNIKNYNIEDSSFEIFKLYKQILKSD